MEVQTKTQAKFSIPSVIAIVCAIGSFASGAVFGFILAMAALLFGAIGCVLAFSSRVRGGLLSTMAVVAGVLGLIAAVIKGIGWLM